VWKCAKLLGRNPVSAIALVGLNPIVLVWGLGGDHNDFLMLFFIVLGFYLLLRGREDSSLGWGLAAGAAFVTAATVKASGAILLPIVLASLVYSPRRLLQTAGGMLLAGALLALVSVAAFGLHIPDLSTQGRLVTVMSPSNLLGLALGQGGESDSLRHLLSFALAASILGACVMAWRKRDSLSAAGWASVALLLTLSWVLPWYVLWVLPMAALSRSRALRTTALVFGIFFVLAWAPLASTVLNSLDLHPEKTSLGRLHQRYVKELLY